MTPATPSAREFCICAALKLPITGKVVYGHRHDSCIKTAMGMEGIARTDIQGSIQGFVTSTGRFVDRAEAMAIQRLTGKPSAYSIDGVLRGDLLFSEDLY